MPAFREEIFGPVAPVIVVRDDDEAVRVANDTEYGLVAGIQTGSLVRGREIADRLTTGIVHINDQTLNNDAYAPFGGTGASGSGARFGRARSESFSWCTGLVLESETRTSAPRRRSISSPMCRWQGSF
jgi:benzaldehyde dehydrogenase (NAD)